MSQSSLQNPMSLLKPTSPTTQPTLDSSFAISSQHATSGGSNQAVTIASSRSRAGSIIRSMVTPSASPSPSRRPSSATHTMMGKRMSSVSEALHLKLSALTLQQDGNPTLVSPYGNPTPPQLSPYPTTTFTNASTTSLSQVSESNWANKYDDFDIKDPIGYGSSAIVYSAIYLPMNKRVALKMIDLDMFERNQIDELRRETALMALSKHPNVLKVYGSFVNGSKLYIITPYLSFGSCLDIMKTKFREGFDEFSIATILKQALEGLVYLHKNGHIHRDVKAGNLLMDDQGTVLLADFGVSSSLSEKGDLRKTFVGTPCWMAPEVMEQEGYDFKADIWSFGITAFELATGHAPFAKYPPMKVLKLTLSNAPPTLEHVHTKYKYSKLFKEMIDLCLQKNPDSRPSAEKLLQHPFFKQCKKKEYLCKAILSQVLPLDQRPHKTLPQKRVSIESSDQWDFDDTPLPDANTVKTLPHDIERQIPTRTPIETTTAPPQQPTRRHITFGDVIVRDRSSSTSVTRAVDIPLHPSCLPDIANTAAATTKKSRFIIEDSDHGATTGSTTSIMLSQGGNTTSSDDHDTSKDITGTKHRYSLQLPGMECDRIPPDSILAASSARHLTGHSDSISGPLNRVASCENFSERKSRFEVQHITSNSTGTSTTFLEQHTPIDISRESSRSSLQPQPQKLGRFSVEKATGDGGNSNNSSMVNNDSNNNINSKDDSRKVGRFELTGRSTTTSSSSDNVVNTTMDSITFTREQIYPQMELLLKQTDAQKVLLQEVMTQLGSQSYLPCPSLGIKNRTDPSKRQIDSLVSQEHKRSSTDLQDTIDHLQQLLSASMEERSRLMKENDALRREVEQLQRQTGSSSS
ncbi:kinase-like domain-containing protein [Halteromyces radiatus]|uniref:kinase-like domain-containing protein n=1 Tax=Halteromyces radiatus TaxID=101107 RepID=UPI00221FC2EC|nr:kinase-like domain-containing protein [Halteromyces radiatus]KAI8078654.1 kinase-like domain-containing protein [Halteromyces radiatus]